MGAIGALIEAGLVGNIDGSAVRVVRIGDHVPPESMREAAAKTKVRTRRYRKHRAGEHGDCLPEHCPATRDGDASQNAPASDASPRDGTGRAGTGTDLSPVTEVDRTDEYLEAWGESA